MGSERRSSRKGGRLRKGERRKITKGYERCDDVAYETRKEEGIIFKYNIKWRL